MKSQLASQEEDKMLKEKLGEVQKQLRGASYHTLLAVSAFIDAGANMMDKAFPRCVKTYGGASNRAVPIKVVIEALAAMTEWEVGAMKSLQDNSELRCLFLYALGKEEGDELTATCMVIKQFVAECADLYQTLGCRLAGLSLEGKAKAGVNSVSQPHCKSPDLACMSLASLSLSLSLLHVSRSLVHDSR